MMIIMMIMMMMTIMKKIMILTCHLTVVLSVIYISIAAHIYRRDQEPAGLADFILDGHTSILIFNF